MIWTIVKREVLEYLKSAKFLIGLGITITLITISTLINLNEYKQRHQDYLNAQQEMKGIGMYAQVYRVPQVLSTLVQGKDRKLGNRLQMTSLELPIRTSGYMGQDVSEHHRYLAGFEAVDFAFVVRAVLSLMVIFLGYNAISEEKFHGTLRLALANRLPRDQLLLGKFIGGLIIVIGSLLISAIITFLIMLLHPAISLKGSDWIRLLLMLGVSAFYLVFFYTLSLFISVVINRPSIALMILLQAWIFLVIIYPNMAVILSENFYSLPSEKELVQRKIAAFQPYEEEYKKADEAFLGIVKSAGYPSNEVGSRYTELLIKRGELGYQVDKEFSNRLTNQMKLAQTISVLSPAAVYDQVMNRLARTGMDEFERFMDGVYRHWQKYIEREKLLFKDRAAYLKAQLPDFTYPSETTSRSFIATLPQWLVIILFSLIFFTLAYTAFLRKDVR
jgi:ABC-type transport system involved in multi-copper enzyme maturation permease subunit